MNKKISLVFAGLAITGAIAGCGRLHVTSTGGALKATTMPTVLKSEAATAGRDALATCLPKGTVITKQYLVSLAVNMKAARALAVKCDIPRVSAKYPATAHDKHPNQVAFAKAVIASASNAYFKGSFKTKAGQEEWANKVFPVILATFQKH